MKPFFTITLSFFTLLFAEMQTIQAQISKSDSLELIRLYESTNGVKWVNPWDLTKPVSTWNGVKLTEDGVHVQSLKLGYNHLNGPLPNLNLPELETLILYDNHLVGTIPDFNYLTKLKELYLLRNHLSGTIPNFDLPNLERLYLDDNQLSGTIPSFNLPNTTYISLSQNKLDGIIPNINLSKLETLDITYNAFTFQSFASHLNIPSFYYSNQDTIPIYKDQNEKTKLYVKAGGNIKDNTYYWYKYGVIHDTIVGDSVFVAKGPGTYSCKVTNSVITKPQYAYQNLILQSEEVVVDPSNLILSINESDSLELIRLYKSTNGVQWAHPWNLTKPVSTWYGVELTEDGHVKNLFLGRDKLKGPLPNLNLPELEILILFDNQLTGAIPNFDLPKLMFTDLSGNQFSGAIPNFDLPNLETIYLDQNKFNGTIPNFNLPNLTYLSLSRNQLSGVIPNFDLPKLETLNVQYNAFTFESLASHLNIPNFYYEDQDTIPVYRDKSAENTLYVKAGGDIKKNTYYWYKYGVAHDTIVGDSVLVAKETGTYFCKVTNSAVTKPDGFNQNLILQSDQIVVNGTTKPILSVNESDSLELIRLYKSTNGVQWAHPWDLTKPVSKWYGVELTDDGHVKNLFLGRDRLKGPLPNLNLPELGILNLFDNQLTGSIPNFDLPKLTYTDLSGNQFSGVIPNFDLPNLETIYLDYNQFSGTIPNFNLPNLTYLSLSRNQLSGVIPNFDLPKLETLNIQYNAFTFESLASHLDISQFFYESQDTIPVYRDKSAENTLYVKAGGDIKKNTYYWYKYGVAHDTIVGDSVLVAKEPGTYFCKVTNSAVTKPDGFNQNLILQSDQIVVNGTTKPILSVNESDSLELIKLYKATDGENWEIPWDLTKPVHTWYGVKLTYDSSSVEVIHLSDNKLKGFISNLNLPNLSELDLSSNQLSGTVPKFSSQFLSTVSLDDNQLSGAVPDFSDRQYLDLLSLTDNAFTFEGIAANLRTIVVYDYEDQDTIPIHKSESKENAFYVKAGGGIKNNTYYWYKDGKSYKTVIGDSLFVATESGTYYCKITNSVVTRPQIGGQNLILQSEKITVNGEAKPILSINESDSLELIKLYNVTNGANWKRTWDLSKPVSTWYGVVLTADSSRIQEIYLSTNKLNGTMPNLNLPKLEDLYLVGNQLSGRIPNLNLPNLKKLGLANNRFSGTIPQFDLPLLTYLDLSSNKLSGSIPNLNLPALEDLFLGYNQLSGTINFDLPNLKQINLFHNKLSGTIPNFDSPKLWFVNLSYNQLTGDIPSFNLQNLVYLFLGNNQLSGPVPNFSHLTKMTDMDIESNKFTFQGIAQNLNIQNFTYENQDTIPIYRQTENPYILYVEAGGKTKENTYNWYRNGEFYDRVVGDSTVIASEVGVYYCKVANSVVTNPDIEGQNLVLQSRKIEVNPPKPILSVNESDSLELIKLYKATNGANWAYKWDLSKPIYTWTGIALTSDKRNVRMIYLSTNQLEGTIPNLNLPKLERLDLGYNQLIGPIPNFTLPELQSLYLGYNPLSGTIPNFDLPKLQELYLDDDQLSGEIPNFDHLPNVSILSLSSNQLSGSIPNFDLPELQDLFLDNNRLSGSIPNFDNLPEILVLNFDYNQLSEALPNFDHLPKLMYLNLYGNKLSGHLPNLDRLSGLDIRKNAFNFEGIEANIGIKEFFYNDQNIIPIAYVIEKNELYVKAGGNTKENTYAWYKDGKKYKTIKGDSVLVAKESGKYYCKVTNSAVTRPHKKYQNLILQSAQSVVNEIVTPVFCLKNDSLELIKLYKAANGSKWINKWDLTKPVSTWDGVKLTPNGCGVQGLYLSYNRLRGAIPNLDLPKLKVLVLDNNELKGTIPNFDLPELIALSLHGNRLTGSIPKFNLPKLEVLYLYDNDLSGAIPKFDLPKLEGLDLRNNRFTFEGIEENLNQRSWTVFYYEGQRTIQIYQKYSNSLYVNAGGNMRKNTYYWYRDGILYKKIVGKNMLNIKKSGKYYCKVVNSSVTKPNKRFQNLVLKSSLADVTINNGTFISIEILKSNVSKDFAQGRELIGATEQYKNDKIILYPNPAKENVSISIEGTEGKRVVIKVLDRFGVLRMTHSTIPSNETIKLNVRSLLDDYYYVRIQVDGKQVVVKPLIIAH